jgi:hypothetical protein
MGEGPWDAMISLAVSNVQLSQVRRCRSPQGIVVSPGCRRVDWRGFLLRFSQPLSAASVLVPRWSRFFVQEVRELATAAELVFIMEARMSHWRKRNPPARWFNAALARWSIVFSTIAGALVVLSLRGHV